MFIDIHTHQTTNDPMIFEVLNRFPSDNFGQEKAFSIGIHPWYIDLEKFEAELQMIENQLEIGIIYAIGECGLDKFAEKSIEIQLKIFERQLELAQKYQKPIIIHCVGKHQEVFDVLKRKKINVPVLFHGFEKKIELAKQIQSKGYYLSLGKKLLKDHNYLRGEESLDISKIFLETDDSNLSISEVYLAFAERQNIKIEELKKQMIENYGVFFKKQLIL